MSLVSKRRRRVRRRILLLWAECPKCWRRMEQEPNRCVYTCKRCNYTVTELNRKKNRIR